MHKLQPKSELLPNLFRLEYSKMTAVLCRHFGLKYLEIAEDIVSETFFIASETWPIRGIPQNPQGWLYTVAKNKVRDHLKHVLVTEQKIKDPDLADNTSVPGYDFEFTDQNISDSQLAMIFAVCNPKISTEAQICLALQVLCGFSAEEIANAFLTKIETIKKRLHRARTNLRKNHFQIKTLTDSEIKARLNTVLRTLYLLFNEGYFSRSAPHVVRKELCAEAVRLALILTENRLTNTPETNALLALLCYQSSRLEARSKENGATILFDEQDKELWDTLLIDQGNYYLVNACNGSTISKYHLEAAIAYWHTTSEKEKKWRHILQLYDQLIQIEYSPSSALSRIFAFSMVHGKQKAITETEKFNLPDTDFYHKLMAHLHAESNITKAISHYKKAAARTKSKTEQNQIRKEIERLNKAIA